jgi:hypothetical protein
VWYLLSSAVAYISIKKGAAASAATSGPWRRQGPTGRQLQGDKEKTSSGEKMEAVTKANGSDGSGCYREQAAAKQPLQITVTNSPTGRYG